MVGGRITRLLARAVEPPQLGGSPFVYEVPPGESLGSLGDAYEGREDPEGERGAGDGDRRGTDRRVGRDPSTRVD